MRLLVTNTVRVPGTAILRAKHPGKIQQRPVVAGRALVNRLVLPFESLVPAVLDRLEYLVSIGNVSVRDMSGPRVPVSFNDIRDRLKRCGNALPTEKATVAAVFTHEEELIVEALPSDATTAPAIEVETASTLTVDQRLEVARAYIRSKPTDEAAALLCRVDGRVGWLVNDDAGNIFVPAPLNVEETLIYENNGVQISYDGKEAGEEVTIDGATVDSDEPASAAASVEEVTAAPVTVVPAPVPSAEVFDLPSDINELVTKAKNKHLVQVLGIFRRPGAGKSKAILADEVLRLLAANPDPVYATNAVNVLRAAAAAEERG